MSCRVHPRYQASRPPRVLCAECWEQWLGRDQALAKLETAAAELKRPWTALEWRAVRAATMSLGPLKANEPKWKTYHTLTDELIAIMANVSRGTARRVLKRLVLAGVLTSTAPSGNRPRLYRVRMSRRKARR